MTPLGNPTRQAGFAVFTLCVVALAITDRLVIAAVPAVLGLVYLCGEELYQRHRARQQAKRREFWVKRLGDRP